MRRSFVTLGIALAAVACGDAAMPSLAPTGLSLRLGAGDLKPGMETSVSAIAGTQTLGAGEVDWASRDASVVTVNRGVVRAIAPGSTYLVAHYGGFIDSLPVVVHFDDVDAAQTVVRLSAAGVADDPLKLRGFALMNHQITDDTYRTIVIASSGLGTPTPEGGLIAQGDTSLQINVPAKLVTGTMNLGPVTAGQAPGGALSLATIPSGVFLRIAEPKLRQTRYYVAVKPSVLKITSITYPPAPGYRGGVVKGSVSFEAAGLLLTSSGVTPIGDHTVTIFAEFSSPVYEFPLAVPALKFTGTPYAGTVPMGMIAVRDTLGRIAISGAGGAILATGARSISAEMRVQLPRAGTGSFALVPSGGTTFLQVGFTSLVTDPRLTPLPSVVGLQTAGTIVITEYQAPTNDDFGTIAGTIAGTLGYGTQAGTTGYTTSVSTSFRIPVMPLKQPGS